ncbi:hypothetical protein L596_011638 [Steinernema carpocapsae]|uniref:Protein kinase domain-containing protein n=1 Tax=Steinernema carpocapsae TaxID=34508 RepID=A0A4V6A4J3_STECR|nr:hypothetical protein L596_011638 [Steinernema carpocapsae]
MARRSDSASHTNLALGKLVGKRWKIVQKLGQGGFGAVFMAEDQFTNQMVALKIESNAMPGGSVLKLEAQILKRLTGRKFVTQLIHAGRKEKYCYMVMTLLGDSLEKLFRRCNKEFTVSTQIRLGIHILFGIKQIHEVGYVHRDIKPANLAMGKSGREAKIVHVLDFGLSREFICITDGRVEMRMERGRCLFRGTTRYCSTNVHARREQSRADDLWSMLYVMAEMRGRLPWHYLKEKPAIGEQKAATTDVRLLSKCPIQMLEIPKHLRELGYYCRPDYHYIYQTLTGIMTTYGYKFMDDYDWERQTTEYSKPKSRISSVFSRIRTIEDNSVEKTLTIDAGTSGSKLLKGSVSPTSPTATLDDTEDDNGLYREEDFAKNELGF